MTKKLLLTGFLAGCLLAGQDTRQKIQRVETQKMRFEPSAALHLENSIGQVNIEGWSRPDVEITIIKSTKSEYGSQKREVGAKELETVKTTFARRNEEIVLATDFKKGGFPPFQTGPPVDMVYKIKMPREVRLIVDQDTGIVNLSQLFGDIRVTVHKGSISAAIPGDAQYSLDAKSRFGTVTSNLAKPVHGLYFLGEQLAYDTPKTSHKLYLRAGSGDIVIVHSPQP
jgi:hypothetical protein